MLGLVFSPQSESAPSRATSGFCGKLKQLSSFSFLHITDTLGRVDRGDVGSIGDLKSMPLFILTSIWPAAVLSLPPSLFNRNSSNLASSMPPHHLRRKESPPTYSAPGLGTIAQSATTHQSLPPPPSPWHSHPHV
ncbi:hypothetical protein VKT23_005361 [Stygiomarasmius scandens]|uniref:Uncharacterized protein n=1 Tax=Marasmiellus scandens TaxID=2682957 RepID=A0ABR1JPU1_9AGAR